MPVEILTFCSSRPTMIEYCHNFGEQESETNKYIKIIIIKKKTKKKNGKTEFFQVDILFHFFQFLF